MESLAGGGYTLLIAAVSPAQRHFDETANTLFFAAKCANIRRRVTPNMSPHEKEVADLKETIEGLRAELTEARRAAGGAVANGSASHKGRDTGDAQSLRKELEAERRRNDALEQELRGLRREAEPHSGKRSHGSTGSQSSSGPGSPMLMWASRCN